MRQKDLIISRLECKGARSAPEDLSPSLKMLIGTLTPSAAFWQIKIADGLTARLGSLHAGYRLTTHDR